MAVKRVAVKDKKIKELLKKGGKKDAKKIFVELLKRATTTPS
jgi:hypothetical protein